MNKFKKLGMDKLVKLTIILGILLVSFSVLYYFLYFLPNLEREKLDLQKSQIQNEKQAQQLKLLQTQRQKQAQQSLLDSCLSDARQKWLDWGLQIKKNVDDCKTQGGGYCNSGSEQAFIDAYNQNDAQLQQDKDNCFKQYPQK